MIKRTQFFDRRPPGMTLIELLVTTAIIAILASMLLGSLGKGKVRANRITCLSNLRQTGVGFTMFANEHNGAFPMDVPANAGGCQESRPSEMLLAEMPQAFACLAGELNTPRLFICPADSRRPAASMNVLYKTNVSFFVGLQASPAWPDSVLAGDRNVVVGTNGTLAWNAQLHGNQGNLLMSDGHAEQRRSWVFLARGGGGGGGTPTGTGAPGASSASNGGGSSPSTQATPPTPQSNSPSTNDLPGRKPGDSLAGGTHKNPATPSPRPAKDSPAGTLPALTARANPTADAPAITNATSAPGEPEEPDSLFVRLAQWAIAAGSLVSFMVALVILLLMWLKRMHHRRNNLARQDLPSEET